VPSSGGAAARVDPWQRWPLTSAAFVAISSFPVRRASLLIAPDQRQAKIALDYCTAIFEQSPILKQLIANRIADTLE
jgi:hypothetical protein